MDDAHAAEADDEHGGFRRQALQYPPNRGVDGLIDRAKRCIAQRYSNFGIVARMAGRSEVQELMLRDMGFGKCRNHQVRRIAVEHIGDDAFTDAYALAKPGLDRQEVVDRHRRRII